MHCVRVVASRGNGSPGTEVTGGWELPVVGAGHWTWVLCSISKHSSPDELLLQLQIS